MLLVLGVLMGFASISTDIYLPAMPLIERQLHGAHGSVDYAISAFLIGFGIGQMLWGPVSDRHGRRLPVAVGMLPFIVGSIGCALSLIKRNADGRLAGAASIRGERRTCAGPSDGARPIRPVAIGADAHIAASLFASSDYYHVSPQAYGLLIGVNILGINRRLLRRFRSERLFGVGAVSTFLASKLSFLELHDNETGGGGKLGIQVRQPRPAARSNPALADALCTSRSGTTTDTAREVPAHNRCATSAPSAPS